MACQPTSTMQKRFCSCHHSLCSSFHPKNRDYRTSTCFSAVLPKKVGKYISSALAGLSV